MGQVVVVPIFHKGGMDTFFFFLFPLFPSQCIRGLRFIKAIFCRPGGCDRRDEK